VPQRLMGAVPQSAVYQLHCVRLLPLLMMMIMMMSPAPHWTEQGPA